MSRFLRWNGTDLPEELRGLPPGRYAIEPADELPDLTDEEEDGIHQALSSLRNGTGRRRDQVRETIASILRR